MLPPDAPFLTLILNVLVPASGLFPELSPRSQVVLLLFGDVIKGESFEEDSFIFENKGVVVHAPVVRSLEGLRN